VAPSLIDGNATDSILSDEEYEEVDQLYAPGAGISTALEATGTNDRDRNDARVVVGGLELDMPCVGNGMVQGMAVSLRDFMWHVIDDILSENESSTPNSVVEQSSYEQLTEFSSGELPSGADGDTVATTTSHLSQISVWMGESGEGLQEDLSREIPYKEQDDPPDAEPEAASLS